MFIDFEEFARRHGLSEEALRELERWGSSTGDNATLDSLGLEDGPARPAPPPVEQRYEDLGPLGQGGMGEVRRVRDRTLNRTVAMKILRTNVAPGSATLARFREEAEATAQLQHPNIVPVHDLGTLPDGRLWFTMKEVRGRTLGEVIAEVHAWSADGWQPAASGWSFRRLLGAFVSVCHAVGFAHERGVVHRDLKPDNVMLGAHNEVYVLDWGLAKILGRPDHVVEAGELDPVRSGRSAEHATRQGQVAGTPAYMPPEQARGEVHRIDARSDVYALGAMLYEILSGRPPYRGSAREVVARVCAGPPEPLAGGDTGAGPSLPDELVAACHRAMAREPDQRFAGAALLAEAVQAWLDGARRREQALEVTAKAAAALEEANELVTRAAALRAEAARLLEGVAGWEPEERKHPGWRKAAEADAAMEAATLRQLAVDQALHAALQVAPELPEAHAALVERYRARHAEAEATHDRPEIAKAETLLRAHVSALPERHPVRREAAAYLSGDGALTLVTEPAGAEVSLFRYEERDRRLVEVPAPSPGPTPVRGARLPMGSYLAILRLPGYEDVRYPFEVTRQAHWDGVPPGATEPEPIRLPPRGSLAPDEVYVPAGWTRVGGATELASFPVSRVWCHAFVMQRFPVTTARYLDFLHALLACGREAEALRHAPRERAGTEGEVGALILGHEGGRFVLRADADGDTWLPDWPVTHVDWFGARAWLDWHAAATGRAWRLPAELEWEKAARGVDGRAYPWGEQLDPTWCRMFDSPRGREHGDYGPVVVDSYPVDTSPCGVRGLGGNVRDWCLDRFEGPMPVAGGRVLLPTETEDTPGRGLRVVRGGAWSANARNGRADNRLRGVPEGRFSVIGFRGARLPDW